ATRRHTSRPMPPYRTPARDIELGGLLGEPQHPVAVGDWNQQVNRYRRRHLGDPVDFDQCIPSTEPDKCSRCDMARPIAKTDAFPNAKTQHGNVRRVAFRQRDLRPNRERIFGIKSCPIGIGHETGPARMLNQSPSTSSAWTRKPARASALIMRSRSSTRIPLSSATPSPVSDADMPASNSISTDETMFARITRTGATSASNTVASPTRYRIALSAPFTRMFSI